MFSTYYADLNPESEGNYRRNEMDGVWKYWNNRGYVTDSAIYQNGTRVAYGKYEYYFKETTLAELFAPDRSKDNLRSFRYSFTDSLKNTFFEKEVGFYDNKPVTRQEADFTGNKGTLKIYDSTGALIETEAVTDRKLEEATFQGGDAEWRIFMQKNLNGSVPVDKSAPEGTYTVVMKFIVESDGTLTDIAPESNPGYGTAEEALRVIKLSPKWKPANQYGRFVRAYRRQPITFLVEVETRR